MASSSLHVADGVLGVRLRGADGIADVLRSVANVNMNHRGLRGFLRSQNRFFEPVPIRRLWAESGPFCT